ncbi:MAG: helix-turn-helix domain-containing protein, partial [Acidobacteriota bacterium]|nr:helix-turn-helix domain-containing protein [Acidobacteriota bacterium]
PGSIQFASRRAGILERATPLQTPPKTDLSLKNSERNLILQALEKTGGNKTKAAALLGISRDVLRYRMKQFKLL